MNGIGGSLLTSFTTEHLLTIYVRTKKLCGGKDNALNDGTVKLSRRELSKLGQELGMEMHEVDNKLIELKQKGEIKGYGNNFKVTKRDGDTKPELLEVTREKRVGVARRLLRLTDTPKKCGKVAAVGDLKNSCLLSPWTDTRRNDYS